MADSFGELLRRFRVAASLTQEALAKRCKISPAAIAAFEQGRRKAPRLSTVRLIAEALELSAADLEALARAADAGGVAARAGSGEDGDRTGLVAGLPTPRTSFIGRDREQAAVLAALAEGRVVSLVGPGGVGKTRLVGSRGDGAQLPRRRRLCRSGSCARRLYQSGRSGPAWRHRGTRAFAGRGTARAPRPGPVAAGARQLRAPARDGRRLYREA